MDIEVQVALNFVISYLYNKLPRRRVNIFGEELEKALKDKFQGHWYPEKPFKGSAFRCLKTGDPVDSVLERAAKESGVPIQDILENLPAELAVWVDPGEVSYRIGEKNMIKILYSENTDLHDESSADREVTKTFNPEAQCFRPIEAVGTSLSGLSLSPKSTSPFPSSLGSNASNGSSNNQQSGHGSGSSSAPSPTPITTSFKGSSSPVPAFIPRTTAPLTFTTATFAQTKFGSTKLKTSSKRANRMSPTEFSNYIKQRAMQQQIHHHHHHQHQAGLPVSQSSPTSRSLSPGVVGSQQAQQQQPQQQHTDPSAYFFPGPYHPQFPHRNIFESSSHGPFLPDLYGAKFPSSYLDPTSIGHQFYGSVGGGSSQASGNLGPIGSTASNANTANQQDKAALVDNLNNFGLGSVTPYPASQYQHLLVAN
ncbi:protein Tob1-like isoform X2 [Chelonus insularis]|uniref:protein Tob1-like isoform X2 n=1 Tax=Chelonus insularis TaxID=460826 RepID=UPI00158C0E52|nr:protein Tob1-like isoform X2 [Chelonus insularis]